MKGQPQRLIPAALANMGERFRFYIMMAILTLFISAKFGLDEATAGYIYSGFYASIYLLALVGGIIADKTKNGPADAKYRIYGYADQQTGTKAGNRRVAENRAKRVYDFLVSQGVKASQLTYEGKGNSPDPFEVQAANRAAVIE